MLVPVNILQALQRNGALNTIATAPSNPAVQVNELMLQHNFQVQSPQVQIIISITNAGMNIHFSANNEFMNTMLVAEPLSFVPITNFLSSSIIPTLATYGP